MKSYWMLGMVLLASSAAAQDAKTVAGCMRANVPETLQVPAFQLEATGLDGSVHKMSGRLYARNETGAVRAMLRIDSPQYLAGASYLMRQIWDKPDEEMYVYLPSVRRVRRVSGGFADGALLSTNFSYNDFKQMQSAFGDLVPTLEAPGTVNGRPAHVLSFRPWPNQRSTYTAVRVWADRETCATVQAEFLEGSNAVKRLSSPAGSLKDSGRYWYVAELRMDDLTDGTHSVIRMDALKLDAKIPGRYLDPAAFHLGK